MELRNNNRAVLKSLAKVSYENSKSRNRLMIGAVALVVVLLFSAFSMIAGRYDAEYLMAARSSGSVVSTYIENPSRGQIKEIRELSYIKAAELEWNFGTVLQEGYTIASCSALDEGAYKEMYEPAFTDIEGRFPKGKDEVMLSRETLDILGIDDPQTGQKVRLLLGSGSSDETVREFTLSGIYTGYKTEGPQSAFFSVDVLDSFPELDRDLCSLLLVKQLDPMSGEYIEEKLYEDVETLDEAQQYLGGESVNYYAMYNIAGSYQVGAVCLVLILLCAWLLISNVMSISLSKDIRYYGMLKTLGTTRRQLRKIILRQTGRMALTGVLSGAAAGTGIVLLLVPKLLENMYLGNYGKASGMMSFHPVFLILAVLFALLITVVSTMGALRKVSHISPVEAFRYADTMRRTRRKKQDSEKGSRITWLAWRNVFANRKKAFLTFGSLFLGITLALTVTVIVRGLDTTHEIEAGHDFVIQYDERVSAMGPMDPLSSDLFQKTADAGGLAENIRKMEGIESYRENYSAYISLDYNDQAWEPLLKANRLWDGLARDEEEKHQLEYKKEFFLGAIATIDEEGIDRLERYAAENGIDMDFDSIRDGTGAINFHFHELSKKMQAAADQVKGSTVTVKNLSGKELGKLKLAGYMNSYAKNLPEVIHLPMRSTAEPGLIVSEKAFENLGLEKKVNYIEADVDPACEPEIKEKIGVMIQGRVQALETEFNTKEHLVYPEHVFYLQTKSDELADAQSYILSMRIIMYGVVALLLLMGIMNYFNVIATSLAARRKEFAVMEAIGMTRKQLRRMLMLEGLYYAGIVSALVLSLGSGILYLTAAYIKQDKAWFVFMYPWATAAAAIGMIFLLCVLLPVLTYKKTVAESVIQRLRHTR